MSISAIIREARVALSRKAQPVWFRVVKWIVMLVVGYKLWGTPSFWPVALGSFAFALTLHFIWRWKTKGWTQPWGGWDDIEAARRE